MADIKASGINVPVLSGNTASRPSSPTTGELYANTETGFIEIYTGSTYGWEQVGGISSVVTGVTATDAGSGRAYNNGSVSVAFTPGTILGRSYTATSNPGGYTGTSSSSPITITGLQSSTQYTYTVTSTNNYGTSAASSASSGVTATTVPQAPTIGTASVADSKSDVSFTAGSTGGSSITSYTATSNPGNFTGTGASSPITVNGLTNGTSYTFTVTATNANGTSTASSASGSVIPVFIGSGYLLAGIQSSSRVSTINKLSFAAETYSTLSSTTPQAVNASAGSANSGIAGYSYGGANASVFLSSIYKLNFTSEAISTLSATLPSRNAFQASYSDSGTSGYSASGFDGSSTWISRIDKLTYSSETLSTTGAGVTGLYCLEESGISNKGYAGYFVSGYSWSTGFVNSVNKYNYSTNSASNVTSYYSEYNVMSVSNEGTAGYSAGGGDDMLNNISKMPFSTDTMSNLSATLKTGRDWGSGMSSKGSAGYFALGRSNINETDKLLFSNDTRSTISPTLTPRYSMTGMSNNGVF